MDPIPSKLFAGWSVALMALLSVEEYSADLSCIFAGLLGGAITQLLTYDTRRPTRNLVIADVLSSGVLGFASMILKIYSEKGLDFRVILLVAIAAGSTGSYGFRALVDKFKPGWIEQKHPEKK